LSDEGCLGIRFIPRSEINGEETPDLEGVLNGMKVQYDVKTVNISDAEATRRQNGGVGSITNSLDEGFFRKLRSDVLKAKSQMEAYGGKGDVRRIAFVVLNFDDLSLGIHQHSGRGCFMTPKRKLKRALSAIEDAIARLKRARSHADDDRSDIARALRDLDDAESDIRKALRELPDD
jgi:hypothetical protein